jgi:glycosyltransferase involved in cell wall biosynthesis
MSSQKPLVSIIVPCYNQGKYVDQAILSALNQSWENLEVIVVNDGSADNTHDVCLRFKSIIYISQENKGLSSARNVGFSRSSGEYIIFLDADDWLQPEAITINYKFLEDNSKAAFVSGSYDRVDKNNKWIKSEIKAINENHYTHLLAGNYIGMHATIMFRRWALPDLPYNISLKAGEDYDLCLHIARKHLIVHHTKKIANYRTYNESLSNNHANMYYAINKIYNIHSKFVNDKDHLRIFKENIKNGKIMLSVKIAKNPTQAILSNKAIDNTKILFMNTKSILMKIFKKVVKELTPLFILKYLYYKGIYKTFHFEPGTINLGDFKRTIPFSTRFGYDRGGPIDRYYIENFLQRNHAAIHGHILEIGDNFYTQHYGAGRVTKSDILHIDSSNENATYIGDLSDAPHIPNNLFDCIILTQTLHLIYDCKGAISTCYRILKPGGTLLLTVPGISQIDYGEWEDTWLWSFTKGVLKRLLQESFPAGSFEVETYGNVLTSAGFLYGMGTPELSQEALDFNDPHFQLIITAKAIKPFAL